MKEVLEVIKAQNLIKSGETIGVAVSGGVDSMSLLHFLNANKEILDCHIVAITIDHCLRENSFGDSEFVKNWCKENGIYCHRFSVDAQKVSQEKNIGIEAAAREARYGIFNHLIKSNIVDKIALAHHLGDQAETILLNILRGAGLSGASGMEYIRDKTYIRPFLDVNKDDLIRYASINYIEYIEDETNVQNIYNRNFLRNVILPQIKQRWDGAIQNLVKFGHLCKEDNDFILSHVSYNGIIVGEKIVKIPLLYFLYHPSIVNRIVFLALEKIGVNRDIERKHVELIKNLSSAQNGKKINLPNDLVVQKEYEYITIYHNKKEIISQNYPFKIGKTRFSDICEIIVKKTKDFTPQKTLFFMDADSLPKDCVWRTRKRGDVFTKFGGIRKSLKSFFIDKKIPSRLRDGIPVLACGSEIFYVLNIEISDNVKITEKTKSAYVVFQKEIKIKKKP